MAEHKQNYSSLEHYERNCSLSQAKHLHTIWQPFSKMGFSSSKQKTLQKSYPKKFLMQAPQKIIFIFCFRKYFSKHKKFLLIIFLKICFLTCLKASTKNQKIKTIVTYVSCSHHMAAGTVWPQSPRGQRNSLTMVNAWSPELSSGHQICPMPLNGHHLWRPTSSKPNFILFFSFFVHVLKTCFQNHFSKSLSK